MIILEETDVAWKLDNGLWYRKPVTEAHWGVCPLCGGTQDRVLHIRRDHYMVCSNCDVAWYVGSNLLSSWRELSQEDFERNEKKLYTMSNADAIYEHHKLSQEDQEELDKMYQEQKAIYDKQAPCLPLLITKLWQEGDYLSLEPKVHEKEEKDYEEKDYEGQADIIAEICEQERQARLKKL